MMKLYFAIQSAIFEGGACLAYRRQRGYAGMLLQDGRRGAGSSLHAIHHHHVGAGLGGKLDVIEGPARAQLHEDRHLAIGCLAQLFNLDHHIVGPEHVRVPGRTALVDAYGQIALVRDGLRNLRAQEEAASTGFRSLADGQFDRARPAHIVHVDSVPRGKHFVHIILGKLPLRRRETPIAGGIGSAHLRCRLGQCGFGVIGERAPAHARNHDGNFQFQGPFGKAAAEDCPGGALLAVAFERDSREAAGQEGQIVESGPTSLA